MSEDAVLTAAQRARQDEWERHARERHAMMTVLGHAITELDTAVGVLKGVFEHLKDGDWFRSPDEMAARARGERRAETNVDPVPEAAD